jgi:hypothetical protein
MVIGCVTTTDGAVRVYLYDDQTAQLTDGRGVSLTARIPLYRIGRELVDRGYDTADLIAT